MHKVQNFKNVFKKQEKSSLFQALISLFTEGMTVYQFLVCVIYKYYLLLSCSPT